MTDDLDLRTVHQAHTPDSEYRRILRTRIEQALAHSDEMRTTLQARTSGDEALVALQPAPDPRRRRSLLLAAAVVVAVAAATIAVVSLDRQRNRPAERPETPTTRSGNGLIAFVAGDPFASARDMAIYTVGPDGSGLRRVTPKDGLNFAPAWSPDGSRLAYVRGGSTVVVADSGSGAEVLSASIPDAGQTSFSSLEWAPDGASILVREFGERADFTSQVIDLQTGAWHELVPATVGPPHWSPDGKWLLVPSGDLFLLPAALLHTGNVDRFENLTGVRRISVESERIVMTSWAPDSSAILIVSQGSSQDVVGTLEIVTIADGSVRTLVEAGYSPTWGPNGQIAYLGDRSLRVEGAEVWVVSADGSNNHLVGFSYIPPRWSPDGTRLVLVDAKGLLVVRSDGADEVRLSPPDLAPTDRTIDWLKYIETFDQQDGRSGDFAPTWQRVP
jgi:WD40 repeat protein